MLKIKYITKGLTVFIIFSVITSCAVNDKEAFNIIDEAKKIFLNISSDKEKNKNIKVLKKEKEVKENLDSKKVNQEKIPASAKKDIAKLKKNNKEKDEIKESKLISRRKESTIEKTNKEKKKLVQSYPYLDQNQLKIGVLLPLTGDHKEIGGLILNALELALFQTDNKKIKLVIRDTKAEAKTTTEVFNELLNNNIKLFIGPLFAKSLVSIEGNVLDEDVKIFALTNNTHLAKRGIWTFGVDPKQQTETILDFIISEGNNKIGFLLPDSAYGYLLYDTIEKVLQKNNLNPARVEFFKNDIDSQRLAAKKISGGFEDYETSLKELETLKNEISEEGFKNESLTIKETLQKPLDSIFIGASGQTLTILASQLQYSSVDPKKVLYVGTSSWEDTSILQEPALKGGLFSTTSEFFQDDINKTYSLVYGSDIPKVAMVAYDILSLLNAALNENGEIKSKYLLNQNGYIGLRGLFRLRFDGTVERTFQIKKIRKAKFQTHQEAPKFFEN